MNAKELREALDLIPDDADLSFHMFSGCCGDIEELELWDVETYSAMTGKAGNFRAGIVFRFLALPGYQSCIEAAATKRGVHGKCD